MGEVGRRRRVVAPLVTVFGTSVLFLLMANEGRAPMATLWGVSCLAVVCVGLLASLGLLQPATDRDVQLSDTWLGLRSGELRWLGPARTIPLALALALVTAATAPAWLPAAIGLGLLLLLPAALRQRPGLLVFVLCSALLLPVLGAFDLWDPWETHYGEVAREILARDDWISLWWAQDRWFWSKPILIFWVEALVWNATLVPFTADSQFQHTEWLLRLPVYAFAILAVLAIYRFVSRRFTTRAGVLSALVLTATPYFGFLTHQAITDMYLVACVTIAVMVLLDAFDDDETQPATSYRVLGWSISAHHLVIAALVCVALPQILYLASRNITFVDGHLFAWHGDDFIAGSAGNGDVPGNPPIRVHRPHYRSISLQPLSQALVWLACLIALVVRLRRERGAQALRMVIFYLFCALAFMGKGLPGIALPGLVALLTLVASNRWSLLLRGRLRVGEGILLIACVSLPWFVAMFVRHGPGFTDRILIHDHINRLTRGVHGDTGTIQYFIMQLGYGLFPWTALTPAALGYWLAGAQRPGMDHRRQEAATAIGLWFAATFTLFSAMTTKFHHYIFPAVPPAAILMGLTLDRMLGGHTFETRRGRVELLLAACAPLPLTAGIGGWFGDLRGRLPEGLGVAERALWVFQHPLPTWLVVLLVGLGIGLLAVAYRLGRPGQTSISLESAPGLAGALLAGALLAAFAGRDLSWTTTERPIGSERLAQLFIYNYTRPWPVELDYRPALTGFTCVLVVLVVLSAWSRLRPLMTQTLVGLGVLFSAFCLYVYMPDATPHWTQAHLIRRYYETRKGPEEPLVAWQMNWKGENYYTGNRVAVFQDLDNKKINAWLEENKGKHAFFLLEHKRMSRFERLMKPRKIHELTTERDCNKFVLVEADI